MQDSWTCTLLISFAKFQIEGSPFSSCGWWCHYWHFRFHLWVLNLGASFSSVPGQDMKALWLPPWIKKCAVSLLSRIIQSLFEFRGRSTWSFRRFHTMRGILGQRHGCTDIAPRKRRKESSTLQLFFSIIFWLHFIVWFHRYPCRKELLWT